MKPKRYKLKKDLPTFKAGDEFELTPYGALVQIINGRIGVCAYAASTLEKFPSILTDWFEEIKPKEPRIKEDKICKIVRDWYGYNSDNLPVYCEDACTLSINHGARIEFQIRAFTNLKTYCPYDITDLCGEEE